MCKKIPAVRYLCVCVEHLNVSLLCYEYVQFLEWVNGDISVANTANVIKNTTTQSKLWHRTKQLLNMEKGILHPSLSISIRATTNIGVGRSSRQRNSLKMFDVKPMCLAHAYTYSGRQEGQSNRTTGAEMYDR